MSVHDNLRRAYSFIAMGYMLLRFSSCDQIP